MRYFQGTTNYTAIPALEGDMGWYPPCIRHQVETVRLHGLVSTMHQASGGDCKTTRMTSTRLTKRVCVWDMDQPRGWCSEVLVTIGNSEYHGDWHDLPTGLINSAREHLQATYCQLSETSFPFT